MEIKSFLSQNKIEVTKFILFLSLLIIAVLLFFIINKSDLSNNDTSPTPDTLKTLGTETEIVLSEKNNNIQTKSFFTSIFTDNQSSKSDCDLDVRFISIKKINLTNVNYTLTIKNNSLATCENINVSVYYSENESFISSNPEPTSSDYYWNIGNLKPNEEKRVFIETTYENQNDNVGNTTESCVAVNNSEDICLLAQSDTEVETKNNVVAAAKTSQILNSYSNNEYGTWVWTSPYVMSKEYMNKIIYGANINKINVIYITIDDYLNIHNLQEGPEKETLKNAYSDSLERFIIAANKSNIQVDVEAGWRDWSEGQNISKANAIIDYAIEYNSSRKNKIRGVQFDVEPYLLPSYERNKALILKNFVGFVGSLAKRMGSNNLKLSIVIPHFYDSGQKWTPSFTYNNITDYTFNHLLRILDTRPGSSIILMSYRNFALDKDGSVEISKSEIDQTSNGNHLTKIIIGQEAGEVEPDYVTFYNTSKSEYKKQISIINNTFSRSKNFGGIAIHYIDYLLELK